MYEKELAAAIEIAKRASKNIMDYYRNGFTVEIKSDDSPVTTADKTSDVMIREYLAPLFPSYSFLTEESVDDKSRLHNDYVWTVDPLDGTQNYVAKDDQFTCNIALVYKHEAVLGVVSIPAKNEIYYAVKGQGAYVIRNCITTQIHCNNKVNDLTCLTSVFHMTDKEIETIKRNGNRITKVEKVGSSIKACLISEGKAELSYRLGDGTKEWDTAAFQIIVEEAGGVVLKLDGEPIKYNRVDVHNRGGYVIANKKENILL